MNTTPELETLLDAVERVLYAACSANDTEFNPSEYTIDADALTALREAYQPFEV